MDGAERGVSGYICNGGRSGCLHLLWATTSTSQMIDRVDQPERVLNTHYMQPPEQNSAPF